MHIGIAPNHDALRELLGAPADLPRAMADWSVGLLREAVRCNRHIVGTLVPPRLFTLDLVTHASSTGFHR